MQCLWKRECKCHEGVGRETFYFLPSKKCQETYAVCLFLLFYLFVALACLSCDLL